LPHAASLTSPAPLLRPRPLVPTPPLPSPVRL
jgi:hypothetical protein